MNIVWYWFVFIVQAALIAFAIVAIWNRDWPVACTWLLADISLTLTTISGRIK